MVKAKPQEKPAIAMESLKSLKHGAVEKKKHQKFKNTPTGKITLINGSKAQNNNDKNQKHHKEMRASPQKGSPKNNNAKNFPQGKNKKQQQSPQKGSAEKKVKGNPKVLVPQVEEEDSDEDIDEGIVPQEEFSFKSEADDVDDDDDDDDDDVDEDVLNIFGTSLADDSDEDDEDFEEDDDDDEDDEEIEEDKGEVVPGKKGVKMFAGLSDADKKNASELNVSSSSSKSSTQESSEEDDDDDDDEEDESALGLKALLGNSIADDDDDDDEDFDGEEEDDEDDDISDEDEEEEENQNVKSKKNKYGDKKKELTAEELEVEKRTIYVGNIPVSVKETQLEKLFKKFGPIESLRFRGIVPENLNTPKKVAAIKRKFHPKQKTLFAYIAFKSEQSAKAALSLNGHVFEGNYLRVDTAATSDQSNFDPKRSLFLGNLSFRTEVNPVWDHFKDCGEIESVRILKDIPSGACKGTGYINFKNEDSVALGLELNGTEILGRKVRVSPYAAGKGQGNKQTQNKRKRSFVLENQSGSPPKKAKGAAGDKNEKAHKPQKGQDKQKPQGKGEFQGQKADLKKKKKMNKLEKKKRVMAAKLVAKPKKPSN